MLYTNQTLKTMDLVKISEKISNIVDIVTCKLQRFTLLQSILKVALKFAFVEMTKGKYEFNK